MSTKFQNNLFCTSLLFCMSLTAAAEVSWYGQINRGILSVDDGHERNTFFVDSAYDNSLAGVKAETDLDEHIKVGGQLELGIMSGISNGTSERAVSQLNRGGSDNYVDISVVDTWIVGSAGKLSLGRGNTASKNSAMASLAGTDLISYAGPDDMAGGMYLHPNGVDRRVQDTDPRIADIFGPINGFGMKDRLRYDSPKFGNFSLATSIATDAEVSSGVVTKNKYCADLALTYEETIKAFQLKGVVATAKSSKDSDTHTTRMYDGSFAVLHINTGLNAAVSLGNMTHPLDVNTQAEATQKKRNFYYVQLGKQAELIKYGKTNFAIDYWRAKHSITDYDKSRAYSVGLVQKIDKINTELYFGIRNYKYDKPGTAYDKVIAALLGIKVNFKGKLS